MSKTIENLYYGNSVPSDRPIDNDGEYKRLLHESAQAAEKLMEGLTDQQKELFNDYVTKNGIADYERECSTFVEGFKIGIRLLIESISDN